MNNPNLVASVWIGIRTNSSRELFARTIRIVQGSGVGPSLFLIYIADLKTQGKDNRLIKFADDFAFNRYTRTSRYQPAGSSVSVECEIKSIKEWV